MLASRLSKLIVSGFLVSANFGYAADGATASPNVLSMSLEELLKLSVSVAEPGS